MKKLELGESEQFPGKNHKDMLEEMCRDLLGYSTLCGLNSSVAFSFEKEGGELAGEVVPWLEVCLLHLPKVLETPNNRAKEIAIRQSCHLHEFFHHPKHIVDYLYYEYQDQRIWTKK